MSYNADGQNGGFQEYINKLMQECAVQLTTRHAREMEELAAENELLKSHIKMYGLPLPIKKDTDNFFTGPVLRSAMKKAPAKEDAQKKASPKAAAHGRRPSALKHSILPAGFRRTSEQVQHSSNYSSLMNINSAPRSNSLMLGQSSSSMPDWANSMPKGPRMSSRLPGSRKVSLQVGCEEVNIDKTVPQENPPKVDEPEVFEEEAMEEPPLISSNANKLSIVQELQGSLEELVDDVEVDIDEEGQDGVSNEGSETLKPFGQDEDPLENLVSKTKSDGSSSSSKEGVDTITHELQRLAAQVVHGEAAAADPQPSAVEEQKEFSSGAASDAEEVVAATEAVPAKSAEEVKMDAQEQVSPPPGVPDQPEAPTSAAPKLQEDSSATEPAMDASATEPAPRDLVRKRSLGSSLSFLNRPRSAGPRNKGFARSDSKLNGGDDKSPKGSGNNSPAASPSASRQASRKNSAAPDGETEDDRRSSWAKGLLRKTSTSRTAILATVKKTLKFADDDSSDSSSHESEHEQIAGIHDDDEEDELTHFWLSPIWEERREIATRKTTVNINIGKMLENICENGFKTVAEEEKEGRETEDELQPSQRSRVGACMDSLMIHPCSKKCILWAILGGIFLSWDTVVIPLHYFELPGHWLLILMSWLVRIYWNVDIFVSFVTGAILEHGVVDMTPEWAICRYARSWMLLDIGMIIIDWSVFAGDISESARMLRILWYFKIKKTVSMSEEIKSLTAFRSEQFMIMLGIIRVITAILAVNHLIACFWYGIGTIGDEENENTWVYQMGYTRDGRGDLYATSFLWSLTQFMGSTAIQPHNSVERVFAIFVLLFAIVFSAFAVSSITTSMTRLQIVTAQQSTQSAMLRMYLAANNISKTLSSRIQRSAQNAVEHLARNTPESSIELLSYVSDPLRIELHYEINSPVLVFHPFFRHYDAVYPMAMRQVCHLGVSKLNLHRGDLVFSNGEMPTGKERMYFLTSGRLLYLHNDVAAKTLKAGTWACEAVLWTLWPHRGSMRAKSDVDILYLDATQFQKTTCQFMSRNANPVHYGTEYVKHLNNKARSELSDLDDERMDKETIAFRVFSGMEPHIRASHISSTGIRLSNNSIMSGLAKNFPHGKVSSGPGTSTSGIVQKSPSGGPASFVTKTMSTGSKMKNTMFQTLSLHIPSSLPAARTSNNSLRGSNISNISRNSRNSKEVEVGPVGSLTSNTLTVPSPSASFRK